MSPLLLFLVLIIPPWCSLGGAEVPLGGGREDPSNHANLETLNSKIIYPWYGFEVLREENVFPRFQNNTVFVEIRVKFFFFQGKLAEGYQQILTPDLSDIVLDFSLPSTFLNESYAQNKIKFPPDLPSPREHNYNNWTVVVDYADIKLMSFHSIGSFITQNFARAHTLKVTVDQSASCDEGVITVVHENIFRGLPLLEKLSYKHYCDNANLLPLYPNVLAGLESVARLGELFLDLSRWSVANWNFSTPQLRSLKALHVDVGALPLPDEGKFDDLQEEREGGYGKDQCGNFLDLYITLHGCSTSHQSSLYLETLCQRQYTTQNVNSDLQSRFSTWGVVFGRDCINLWSIESRCDIPFQIPKGCTFLDKDALGSTFTMRGFVVDDYVLASLNQGNGYYLDSLTMVNILWNTTGVLNITVKIFEMDIHEGNSHLLPVSSAPVINFDALCGPCPCLWLRIDGGERNTNPPIVTAKNGMYIAKSEDDKKTVCNRGEIQLSHVHVNDNAWRLFSSYNYHLRGLYLYQLRGRVNFRALFPCSRPIDGPSHSSLNRVTSDERCIRNASFGMNEIVIETRNDTVFPFYFDEDIFVAHPNLRKLQLTNVKIVAFEPHSSQLTTLALVNAGITSLLRAVRMNGTSVTQNDTLSVLLSDCTIEMLNFSYNQISVLDWNNIKIPGPDFLGIVSLDLSHNILTDINMTVFHVMNYQSCTSCYEPTIPTPNTRIRRRFVLLPMFPILKLINLSYNKLSSFSISDDFPPPGYGGVGNIASSATLTYGKKAYGDYKLGFIAKQALTIDLSYNNITQLSRNALSKLASLTHLNLAHNNISSLTEGLLDSSSAYKGCVVDLSHNSLGLSKSLNIKDALHAPVQYLKLSHNGLKRVPSALRQVSINYGGRFTNFKAPYSDISQLAYPVVDLSHNNIERVDESLCGHSSDDQGGVVEAKSAFKSGRRYLYINLSHNNLTHLSTRALDCGDVYILLNINHNPISKLPDLPKKQFRLRLLSAANTSIVHIPKSYSLENLYALKSIFINNTYDGSPLKESANLWSCCEIAPLTRVVENSTLMCINVDMVSDQMDLISANLLDTFNVNNQKCVLNGKIISYRDFTKKTIHNNIRDICKGVDWAQELGKAQMSLMILTTLIAVLFYFLIAILSPVVHWMGGQSVVSEPMFRWPVVEEDERKSQPSYNEYSYVLRFNDGFEGADESQSTGTQTSWLYQSSYEYNFFRGRYVECGDKGRAEEVASSDRLQWQELNAFTLNVHHYYDDAENTLRILSQTHGLYTAACIYNTRRSNTN
eukprot:Nk52_evm6s257 gene=Nk52_evmTU6s257